MNNLLNFFFNSEIVKTYNRNLNLNGFTPLGLFLSSKKSQYDRFDTFLFLIMKFKFKHRLRISDIGCGYGSLLHVVVGLLGGGFRAVVSDVKRTCTCTCTCTCSM